MKMIVNNFCKKFMHKKYFKGHKIGRGSKLKGLWGKTMIWQCRATCLCKINASASECDCMSWLPAYEKLNGIGPKRRIKHYNNKSLWR